MDMGRFSLQALGVCMKGPPVEPQGRRVLYFMKWTTDTMGIER